MMENKYTPERRELLLAGGMVLCGFLFWEGGLISPDAALGKFTFTLVLCIVSGSYLWLAGYKQDRNSVALLVCMALLGGALLNNAGRMEHALTQHALAALYLYWVAKTTANNLDDRLSMYALGDLVKQGLAVPFSNYGVGPLTLARSTKGRCGKNIFWVCLGIALAIPFMTAAFMLLSEADSSFKLLAKRIAETISWRWVEYIVEIIVGLPVAFYLVGLVYGNARGDRVERFNKEALSKAASAMAIFPSLIGATMMTCLNLIYIVFLGLQVSHLMQGLPRGMSYSVFARQGFFQLCTVAVINLAIVIAGEVFHKRGGRAARLIKIQMSLMSALTIGLSCTALTKMGMYINVYGLTHKRIYTSFFMVFLIVVFLTIALAQFAKINAGKIIAIAGLVLLLIFNYACIDRSIARYNIDRYEKGTLSMMDSNLLYALDDGALPELYKLWEKTGDKTIAEILKGMPANDSWACLSRERIVANRIRKELYLKTKFD